MLSVVLRVRPRENFRGFSARWFLKNLGQFLSALAISGHSERFSPGEIRSEVGGPIYINSPPGPPTSERIWPGEISTEGPEIARALGKWPKFFKNHCAENPQKFSRGLMPMLMKHWFYYHACLLKDDLLLSLYLDDLLNSFPYQHESSFVVHIQIP